MPQPAEVDQIAEQLVARYQEAIREWQQLVAATAGDPPAKRLRELQQGVDRILGSLDADVRDWITTSTPQVWSMGATAAVGAPFPLQASLPAIQAMASQNYSELLSATSHVAADTKRALRTLARGGALDVLGGQTANASGLKLTNALQDAASQVMTVTYRNGAVHSLADWADTAVRTQTALAYNDGALGSMKATRIKWVEIADGPACGLTAHDDPELADGLVVPIETAEAYPVAHPRCARSLLPRGDIDSEEAAKAANDARDMDALEAQALEERQRAAQRTVTGRRMTVASEERRVARRERAGRTERPPRRVRAS